ncbi:hypothetical protein [Mesorhizobium sp. Mes31]|jgi:hypothetical protein|uniref:hypothetical protein n=1 Tax=Mesorhizobium sp. Mes31 TaxID=2926017 RepID=UPI0021197BD2|nr:hypothetical protein [Mesorhizobium sp. Mes31]
MADLSGDLVAGHYAATGTVFTGRRNLFSLEPGNEHHVGTLVSGSRTKLLRFNEDCDRIVRGLAMLDANDEMLTALKSSKHCPSPNPGLLPNSRRATWRVPSSPRSSDAS